MQFSAVVRSGGLTLIVLVGTSIPGVVAGQEAGYVVLPEVQEIALARSAAPAEVSSEADIWVVRNGRYELAVKGSNGNACVVMRNTAMTAQFREDSRKHIAPICFDEEAARSIFVVERRKLELRLAGMTVDEIKTTLATEFGSGELPTPRRPAMSYMMSSGQQLHHSGHDVGKWKPHIMLYMPFLTAQDIGLHKNKTGYIQLQNEGTPTAMLLVVVQEFVDPSD